MPRDLPDLAAQRADLVIVGGGIHGLMAAYDAAARGLSVVLVERGDFGAGLSFNHQRTIHGGLRDVGAGRFGKARRQIAERRAWARMAPHLIRPLPFLVGTYGMATRSRLALRAGFRLYDAIGRHRNRDVPPELHLPAARLESIATTRRLFPGVRERGLTGGAIWYDYQTRHPDRLNWTIALAATRAGARIVNYVEAIAPIEEGGRVAGVRVRDLVTGRDHDIAAAATLLAAGSGLGALQRAWDVIGAPPHLRAMNLLIDRPARDIAVAAPGPGGRMLTLVPWRGRLLAGTFQSAELIAADAPPPPAAIVQTLLTEANAAFPALGAAPAEVALVHHGLVPGTLRRGRAELIGDPVIIAHAAAGRPGVFSLAGVKFTTARHAAERAVDAVCRALGRRAPCRTSAAALPHAGIADVEGRLTETARALGVSLDRDVIDHLTGWYGTEASGVLLFGAGRGLLERLSADTPLLAAEIAYAAGEAHAVHLTDAVLRRTPLGSAGHPGRPALEAAARVMADACGWTPETTAAELAAVEAIYPSIGR
jgi:glycerol-3-phosphate dehydrogenase